MRFHLLPLALTSSLFFTPSLTSPSDVLYIEKLTAEFAINLDKKNFKAYDVEFTPKATYDPGNGVVATGIPAIKALLALVVGNVTTQTALTTQSINLGPPFNGQGAAGTASAITYVTVTSFGQGADEGKAFSIYGFWTDKFVKTGDFAQFGGWRFSSRVIAPFVSFCLLSLFLCGFCFSFFLLPPRGIYSSRIDYCTLRSTINNDQCTQ